MKSVETITTPAKGKKFNPHRLVSNEEFSTNLNAIIAYYQVVKGEAKKRLSQDRAAA
jgi:hypothetical protein